MKYPPQPSTFSTLNHFDRIWEEIAGWGTAKLMKDLDGRYKLVGGSEQDREAAEKWIARFIHRGHLGAPAKTCLSDPD